MVGPDGTHNAQRRPKTASEGGGRPGVLKEPEPPLVVKHAVCPCSGVLLLVISVVGADGVDDTTAAYLLRVSLLLKEEGGGGGGEGASGKGAAAPGDEAASCRCHGEGAVDLRAELKEEEEKEEEEVAEVFLSPLFRRSRFSHLENCTFFYRPLAFQSLVGGHHSKSMLIILLLWLRTRMLDGPLAKMAPHKVDTWSLLQTLSCCRAESQTCH